MHPLDLAFIGSLKCYRGQEAERWLRVNPLRALTIYQVRKTKKYKGELFGNAYMRAAITENAASSVRKAGFYPCNNDNTFRPRQTVTTLLLNLNQALPAVKLIILQLELSKFSLFLSTQ
jgi:hypothetical protein